MQNSCRSVRSVECPIRFRSSQSGDFLFRLSLAVGMSRTVRSGGNGSEEPPCRFKPADGHPVERPGTTGASSVRNGRCSPNMFGPFAFSSNWRELPATLRCSTQQSIASSEVVISFGLRWLTCMPLGQSRSALRSCRAKPARRATIVGSHQDGQHRALSRR